jgi:hypothetical protein
MQETPTSVARDMSSRAVFQALLVGALYPRGRWGFARKDFIEKMTL